MLKKSLDLVGEALDLSTQEYATQNNLNANTANFSNDNEDDKIKGKIIFRLNIV